METVDSTYLNLEQRIILLLFYITIWGIILS